MMRRMTRRRADDPARRSRRVLRRGRAARRPDAARQAGDRRRRRAATIAASSARPRTRRASSACARRCRCGPPRALCPDAIFVPVDGRKYSAVSRQVMAILRRFSPLVEQLSIDEAFLDVAGTEALFGSGEDVAPRSSSRPSTTETGADRVGRRRGESAGGQDRLRPAQAGRPGRRAARRGGGVPGAAADRAAVGRGREHAARAGRVRRRTIGDLAALPEDVLRAPLRQARPRPAARARGIGETEVGEHEAAKSVSHEHTFDVDTSDWEVLERTLLALTEGVAGPTARDGRLSAARRGQDSRLMRSRRSPGSGHCPSRPTWAKSSGARRSSWRGGRCAGSASACSAWPRAASASSGSWRCSRRRRAPARRRRRRLMQCARRTVKGDRRARLLDAGVRAPFERDPRRLPIVDPDQRRGAVTRELARLPS